MNVEFKDRKYAFFRKHKQTCTHVKEQFKKSLKRKGDPTGLDGRV